MIQKPLGESLEIRDMTPIQLVMYWKPVRRVTIQKDL